MSLNVLSFPQVSYEDTRLASASLTEWSRANHSFVLDDEFSCETDFPGIVGRSSALLEVLQLIDLVAESDATVLLLGETGTGKELIARAIHARGLRQTEAFVTLNCAAIPGTLFESELFGHEKGSFTGAYTQKVGRLEMADRGTLFLDEIGDMPLEIQPKLLRALQERTYERVGSARTKSVDVRLVAATNRDLEEMMAERQFRSDLYYRLNVFPIRIPPLRERREDIPLLVQHFTQKYARRMGKRIETVPAATMQKLVNWHWPGNVRELQNMIERGIILSRGSVLEIPLTELKQCAPKSFNDNIEASTLSAFEREHILRALRDSGWVVGGPAGAAARLGLNRSTLNARMRKLGITRPRPE
jgi:formate hydrogenlyase transcriptional activator